MNNHYVYVSYVLKAREKLRTAEICLDLQTAAKEENEANTKRSSRRLRQ